MPERPFRPAPDSVTPDVSGSREVQRRPRTEGSYGRREEDLDPAERRSLRWAREVQIALAPLPPVDILERLADRYYGNSRGFVSEFGRRVYGGTKARPSRLDERGRPLEAPRAATPGASAWFADVPHTEASLLAVLRHQFTNYDSLVAALSGSPGADLAYPVLKERVNRVCRRELAAMGYGDDDEKHSADP